MLPDDSDDIAEGAPVNGPSGLTAQELGVAGDIVGLPVVEVMIAYDTEAFSFYGSDLEVVRLHAAHMVNLTNAMYRTSSSQQHMNLTHVYATGSAPSNNSINTYLGELTNKSDGRFDGVHPSRDANGADLVALLSNRFWTTGNYGLAWIPGGSNPAEERAYSISEVREAITGLTFPHEVAHNQCAGHDLDPVCGYADSTGHVDAAAGRKSVMARRGSCPACTREPVYSNPSVSYQGWTTGVAGVSDNHRVMEIEDLGGVSGGVANYRVGSGTSTSVAGVDGNSCIYASLEDAFNNAPTGSTIFVAPGTYPAQSSGLNFNVSRDVDVEQGTAQCEPTTSGTATNVVLQLAPGSTADAVMEVSGDATVRFERITFEGGNSSEGTVRVFSGDVTLDGTIIRNGNNPSNDPDLGGGGLRVDQAGAATMINNGSIINNNAVNGGGVFVNGGSFTIADTDDVESNTATDGGGIYATNDAQVTASANADVLDNTASADGGGIHLTGGADLTLTGDGTHVGYEGQANDANRGGGVFVAAGSAGSTVTLGNDAEIRANTASFGGGAYLLGGEIEVNDDGVVRGNEGSVSGGGILAVNSGTEVDLNAGALITGNSGGLGGGLRASTGVSLQADGAAGPSGLNPVVVSGNTATDGGGLYQNSTMTADLDTIHFVGNTASDEGGGIFVSANAAVSENSSCDGNDLAFEQYCSEFHTNSATRGGAVFSSGGVFSANQTAFNDNSATGGAQAVHAVGASDVDLFAVMILGHDSTPTGDGTVTAADTSNVDVTAATSVDAAGAWYDIDGSGTGVINRTIATTNTFGAGGAPSGSCNLQVPGAASGLPGAVTVDPQFVTTANSAHVPIATSPATDACTAFGVVVDILDSLVKNGDGLPSPTEYDMGAIEGDQGLGYSCAGVAATIVGTTGADTFSGTSGPDVIVALGGDDNVNGLGGADRICAGDGDDDVRGGQRADTVFGGSGVDTLSGGPGNDTLNGGNQRDRLAGNAGADTLNGQSGNDRLDGNGGRDTLRGGGGRDVLEGDGGRDTLRGDAGNDVLRGGAGDDLLNGNAGNDTLFGGSADDTLVGHGGNDALRGQSGSDVLRGGPGSDNVRGGPSPGDRCNGQGGRDRGGEGCEVSISIP